MCAARAPQFTTKLCDAVDVIVIRKEGLVYIAPARGQRRLNAGVTQLLDPSAVTLQVDFVSDHISQYDLVQQTSVYPTYLPLAVGDRLHFVSTLWIPTLST